MRSARAEHRRTVCKQLNNWSRAVGLMCLSALTVLCCICYRQIVVAHAEFTQSAYCATLLSFLDAKVTSMRCSIMHPIIVHDTHECFGARWPNGKAREKHYTSTIRLQWIYWILITPPCCFFVWHSIRFWALVHAELNRNQHVATQ